MSEAPGRHAPAQAQEVHATCVSLRGIGVLLRGDSGSGKSDLAFRLIEEGARLVADDRVRLTRRGVAVMAEAPSALSGLIEVRGLGIVRIAPERLAAEAVIALVVDLVPGAELERLPPAAHAQVLGVAIPCFRLDPFAASAPAKLRLAAGAGPGSIMAFP